MSKPNLSKQAQNVASIPSKYPYIYPYKLPSGEIRFRVRIRKKTFAGKPLLEPINEVYQTLEQAKKRLYDLEFGNALAERELVRNLILQGSNITIGELLEAHYKKRLEKKANAKYYKSKIGTIKNTLIDTEDNRITKVANFSFDLAGILNNDKTKFGDFHVNNFDITLLNRFVDARREKVKPQTVANEVVLLNGALRDGHNLFTNLEQQENPLKGFNWKILKSEVTPRDKRVRPEHKKIIQELFLKHSRSNHYHDLFIFLHETGCRISEALSIKVADIDLNTRIIHLATKKNNKGRYIGISAELFPIVQARVEGKQGGETIFPYNRDTYEGKLTRIRPKLTAHGIKFSWHDLRHNYISNHLGSKNLLKIMNELNITDMQYFQSHYLDSIESEKAALKVAQGEALTPQEVANVVGHFGNLEQTQEYTNHAPQESSQKLDLVSIVKQQQDQLRIQQEQIAQLMQLIKKD